MNIGQFLNRAQFIVPTYFIGVNGATVYAFYDDKQRALKRQWRIPEKALCSLGLLGGWPAGYWAMKRYNHKTKKESFRKMFMFSTVSNVLMLGVIGHQMKGGRSLFIQKLLKEGKTAFSQHGQRSATGVNQQHTFKQNPTKSKQNKWKSD